MKICLGSPSVIVGTSKTLNLGDILIENAIINLLKCESTKISCRIPLTNIDYDKINTSDFFVIAGANQLSNNYIPNFDIDKISKPIIYMGLGIAGNYPLNKITLSSETISFFNKLFALKTSFISTRDIWTKGIFDKYFNNDKAVLTGCPVLYGYNNITTVSQTPIKKIIFTMTNRGEYWKKDLIILDQVIEMYKDCSILVVFHQWCDKDNYETLNIIEELKKRGIAYLRVNSVEAIIDIYKEYDMHIGSRLHGHILMTCLGKKSNLLFMDHRHTAFSETFNFPLGILPKETDLQPYFDKIINMKTNMNLFIFKVFK